MTEPPSVQIVAGRFLEPGGYLLRLVRGGPWVGAVVTFDPATGWTIACEGEFAGPSHTPWELPLAEKVAIWGQPATEDEIRYRAGLKQWALLYRPDDPAANPRRAINPHRVVPF